MIAKIAACWITKGDEELEALQNSVESIVPYVAGIYITATSNKTAKTKQFCRDNGFHYSHFPWIKDFSAARNFNFSQIPEDYDYAWWMDSDDILVGGENLQEVAQKSISSNIDAVFFTYWYSCIFEGEPTYENLTKIAIQQPRERLINFRKIKWKGRLHETPMEKGGASYRYTTFSYDAVKRPIAVLHTAANPNEPEKFSMERTLRNKEILELQLEDEKKLGKVDPRTIIYLIKIYAELHDLELAKKTIALGEDYLNSSGWDVERCVCCIIMGRAYSDLGQMGKANEYFHQAIKEFPYTITGRLRLAENYLNLKKHGWTKLYLEEALNMDTKKADPVVDNILENEILSSIVGYRLYVENSEYKDFHKAYEFAKHLYDVHPTEEYEEMLEHARVFANLDNACKNADKLIRYLVAEDEEKAVFGILQSLPQSITKQPFAIKHLQSIAKPKIWGKDEICYYATFGGPHFEQWDANSLKKGIGGSETAVIELAKEWVRMGYRVTVYGDPAEVTKIDGVNYLPYYFFNPKDKFNIFIQWRNTHLAGRVSAKKYFVDLHDVVNAVDYVGKENIIDGVFVKSKAHAKLLGKFPTDKTHIISNGIPYGL